MQNNIADLFSWVSTAKDELTTIEDYIKKSTTIDDQDSLLEITGDEFNHVIIATLQAAKAIGLRIPVDGDLKELISTVLDEDVIPGAIEEWPKVE